MARSHARILTAIWHDEDFRALDAMAQRVYMLALSQPDVSFCGVVPYTARRWARFATDTTPKVIVKAVSVLVRAGFVLLDEDTEELWLRSFVKHDGVLKSPNLRVAMRREFDDIHSPTIRQHFLQALPAEYRRESQMHEPFPEPFGEPLPEPPPEGFAQPLPEPIEEPLPEGSRARSAEPPSPSPTPPPSPPLATNGSRNGKPRGDDLAASGGDDEEDAALLRKAQAQAQEALDAKRARGETVKNPAAYLKSVTQQRLDELRASQPNPEARRRSAEALGQNWAGVVDDLDELRELVGAQFGEQELRDVAMRAWHEARTA